MTADPTLVPWPSDVPPPSHAPPGERDRRPAIGVRKPSRWQVLIEGLAAAREINADLATLLGEFVVLMTVRLAVAERRIFEAERERFAAELREEELLVRLVQRDRLIEATIEGLATRRAAAMARAGR